MQHRVDAFAHAHHLFAVGQVALHHFLVRTGGADVGHVRQAHDVGEVVQALAQAAAKVAAGAGEEDAFEWFAHGSNVGMLEWVGAPLPDDLAPSSMRAA